MTTMTTTSLVTSAESFTSKTMPHRICMVSLWYIPEYNPRDCKMNLWAQLCLKNFNQKCMIQVAMNRNIKLCRPLLFLDQLLGHLHDYDALLPSRWPFPPPPSTWCAPWPARQAPPTWCAPWPPCHAPSTWCAPWPPRQAPPPSHPWCPPWAVSRKSQEKCAKKRRKKIGGGSCPPGKCFFLGGGKCPNLGVVNVRILGVVNVRLANNLTPFFWRKSSNIVVFGQFWWQNLYEGLECVFK